MTGRRSEDEVVEEASPQLEGAAQGTETTRRNLSVRPDSQGRLFTTEDTESTELAEKREGVRYRRWRLS